MRYNFKKSNTYDDNFKNILENTFKFYGKTVSKSYMNELGYNPLFPSIGLLEKTFKHNGFSTLIVNIDSSRLIEVPLPTIAHLDDSGGKFVIITKVGSEIEFYDSVLGFQSEKLQLFTRKWNGILLLLEENEEKLSENFYSIFLKTKKQNHKMIILSAIIFILIGNSIFFNLSISSIFYSILSILGIALCVTIKSLEFNLLPNSICNIGNNIDCNSVLSSNGSVIFKNIKASDLGLFWYVFMLLNVFLFQTGIGNFNVVNNLGLISILYVPYSLIYQGLVIKKWCLLCLAIQSLIISHFLYFFVINAEFLKINTITNNIWDLIGSLFIAFITVYLYKKYLNEDLLKSELALSRNLFALDDNLFKNQLENQPLIDTDLKKASVKTINKTNDREICIVLNPLCEACKKSFDKLFKLYTIDPNININVILVRKWYTDHEEKIFRLILNEDFNKRFELLKEIMINQNFNHNSKKIIVNEDVDNMIAEHQLWFESSELKFTPRFLFNNKMIPEKYHINDIIYHLF